MGRIAHFDTTVSEEFNCMNYLLSGDLSFKPNFIAEELKF